MREQERDDLVTLLDVEVGKEVGEEEVERLREVDVTVVALHLA